MSSWIYHTPSKHGEVGPGYEPGMECEYTWRLKDEWEPNGGPSWDPGFTYRYRTATPVEEVPEWAYQRAVSLAGYPVQVDDDDVPLRGNLYNLGLQAFARYIAAHEDPPEDPLVGFVCEMFEVGNAPRSGEDLANAVEYARDHADALIAALKGDTE